MSGPLHGLRVCDMTRILAGPSCTQMLGDLGADVIKIERPGAGDDTRKWGPPYLKGPDGADTGESGYYLAANRNKRSVTIDYTRPEGRDILRRLVAQSDVLIENYRVGTLGRYGLGYDDLKSVKPGLVYCSVTGFGQEGPYAPRAGYDLLAQAMGGIMSITGDPDGPPAKSGVPVADIASALFAVYAILSAYISRLETGEGQYLDACLFEAAIAFAVWDISEFWGTGRVPPKLGTAHRKSAPYQAVRASDGYFVIGANSDKLWRTLCELIERPDLLKDSRFATIADRLANRVALIQKLKKTFVTRPAEDWIARLLDAGLPAGPIYDYAQTLDNDHARHRNVVMEIDHPVEGKVRSIGFPVKLSGTPQQVRMPPPLLGAHTEEIVTELGFGAEALEKLRAAGAFAP